MKLSKSLLLVSLALISVASFAQIASPYLIYNCKVINILDGSVEKSRAILIDGSQISKVDSFSKLKEGIPKSAWIDAKGKFVIPGLWDMHIHLEGKELLPDNEALLPVFLAYGITTVRDCASDLGEQVLTWRDHVRNGQIIGPTLFTAGRKLEGKNSIWKDDLEIANEEELQQMLNKLDDYDVDFIKITENTLSGELFLKSVGAANGRGYRVSGHVPIDLTVDELVDAGFTSVEHASYMLRLGTDQSVIIRELSSGVISRKEADSIYFYGFDQKKAIEGYRRLGDKGLYVCPTLIGGRQLAFLAENNHQQDDFLKYLTHRYTSNYAWRIDRMANDTEKQKQERKDKYELVRKQLPYMQASGIKIIAGSDAAALNTFVYPAASLIEELILFQESGLKPIEVLQSATINGASYFGKPDGTATINPNEVADLVILDQNPLIDIKAIKGIYAVISKGRYLNREDLDEILRRAVEAKVRLDKQRGD